MNLRSSALRWLAHEAGVDEDALAIGAGGRQAVVHHWNDGQLHQQSGGEGLGGYEQGPVGLALARYLALEVFFRGIGWAHWWRGQTTFINGCGLFHCEFL